ncbi:hypothetical protein PanWU01x14_006600 [Parasponia andersonii]|uniref:Uncharacterized protein n=1 Tax=Parasponia andersonii TaxID=3476 RepID=A0A2P5E3X1_PARAD|nr:hypothetical protein PanWU01x14_006600 [Parasponia andersonii]
MMAPSRMTTSSTHPDAEGSSQDARPGLEQKLDQMFAALAEANRKAEMAHEAVLGLKDEVAEVRRDNARLEGLLASEARNGRREDFDKKVQQESRDPLPKYELNTSTEVPEVHLHEAPTRGGALIEHNSLAVC